MVMDLVVGHRVAWTSGHYRWGWTHDADADDSDADDPFYLLNADSHPCSNLEQRSRERRSNRGQ